MRWTPDRKVRVRALAGSLCCVLGQDILLSQCRLSPPRSINGYSCTSKLSGKPDEMLGILAIIVIIRNWLGNPANFKGTNKDQKIFVGWSTTLHNLLFCAHTLWLNCVTVTFLLVSSSGTNHDLLCLFVQKHRTNNFAKLPNHLPLLTMLPWTSISSRRSSTVNIPIRFMLQ